MTLGDFIEELERLEANGAGHLNIRFDNGRVPNGFCSWRGRYAHCTIDSEEGTVPIFNVGALLSLARDAVGATMEGYKGGDFTMTAETPLWADEYGRYQANIPASVEQIGDEVVVHILDIYDYA